MRHTALLLVLAFCCLFLPAQSADVFKNPTAGFEITKPPDWHYATAEQNAENLRAVRMGDPGFQAAMLKYATTPLVVLTKFEEPFPDLNPSLKVNIRPLGQLKGRPPGDIIRLVLPQLERAFKDFQLKQPPSDAVVAGLAASYLQVYYTLQTADGSSFPAASELWIVPRGDFFFMIGAGTRQDEKTGSREEIAAILKSVKISR